MGHREWLISACSGWQDDGLPDGYMHRQTTLRDPSFGLTSKPRRE